MLEAILAWSRLNAQFIEAAATGVLAVFASVQVGLEIYRKYDQRRAAKIRLEGPAWIARRNFEAVLEKAVGERSAPTWGGAVGSKRSLTPLQGHMLETLRLASVIGGVRARAAQRAFEHFLAFADEVNHLNTLPASGRASDGSPMLTPHDREIANATARSAIGYLRSAIAELEQLAPRRDRERPLPEGSSIPLLVGSPNPYASSASEPSPAAP